MWGKISFIANYKRSENLKKLDHVLSNFVVSLKDCTFKESHNDFSFNFQ